MALFGEKYGDQVRVIQFGSSVELCGGTHVKSTGEIGVFKVISESSVAAGIRRIEAVTGHHAISFYNSQVQKLEEINEVLGQVKDIKASVLQLKEENVKLQHQIDAIEAIKTAQVKEELLKKATLINDIQFIGELISIENSEQIKNLCFQLKNEIPNLMMVLGAIVNKKATISIIINESLVKEKGWSALQMIKEISPLIKGGGGGQPFYATAGGTEISGIQAAIEKVKTLVS